MHCGATNCALVPTPSVAPLVPLPTSTENVGTGKAAGLTYKVVPPK